MSAKTKGHHHSSHPDHAGITEGSADRTAPPSQKVSEDEKFRLTQLRAYGLWEQAGRPEGDAAREQFWSEAEKECLACHASDG